MRAVTILAAAVTAALAGVLGLEQCVASVALRDRAVPGSWVRLVSAPAAARIERVAAQWPLPAALRIVLAERALAEGDRSLARRDIGLIRPSGDRLELEGRLAALEGDRAAAMRDDLASADLPALEADVAGLTERGDLEAARALLGAAAARLGTDPTQADALAETFFQLGRLDETRAYALAVGSPARHADEVHSRDDYARAVALSPLEERYLIAYGNQLLNVSDLAAAAAVFARARGLDPTSAQPPAGLGETALRRGDLAAAREFYVQAYALEPRSPAVGRLRRELEDAR
jgi:hypothetical protein